MKTSLLLALLLGALLVSAQAHRHRHLEEKEGHQDKHGKHTKGERNEARDEEHHRHDKNGTHHHGHDGPHPPHGPDGPDGPQHHPHLPFEPHYEVLNKTFAWELRQYSTVTYVSTNTSGWTWELSLPSAVKRLMGYFEGANQKGKHFPPGVPLLSRFLAKKGSQDGDFSNCEREYMISAYLPRKPGCNATFPEPIDKSLKVRTYPATKVFVKEFHSAFWGSFHWAFQREGTRLARALMREGIALEDGIFFGAVYDPPFKFFDRRNEVWFALPEKNTTVSSLVQEGVQSVEAAVAQLTQPTMQTS